MSGLIGVYCLCGKTLATKEAMKDAPVVCESCGDRFSLTGTTGFAVWQPSGVLIERAAAAGGAS